MNRSHRRGLTLLELVVVLAILAVLALVAVLSTETVVDQSRYDVTRRTLDNTQDAVLGLPNADPNSAQLAGFVADTGRLPLAVGTDPATQLAELWSNPRGLPAFGLANSTDPDVKLLVGWRGPYLRLPPQLAGPPRLLDGWGNAFTLLRADLAPAGDNDAVVHVRSNGGPAPYNAVTDMTQPFVPTALTGTVTGSVTDADPNTPGSNDVEVKLYAPDVSQPGGVREFTTTATAATGYTFSFPNVTIGPKALRATQTIGMMPPTKSGIAHFRMPAGGLTRTITLDIK